MAGLYETVIDLALHAGRRSARRSSARRRPSARPQAQVRALFDRSVLQFPPPGFDATDSFFAVRDDDGPDRLYVGVTTAGPKPEVRAAGGDRGADAVAVPLVHGKGQAADVAIDPYWTCVAYFNSLRELGGAYVLMQDDVPRQMQFLAGRLGAATTRP